MFTAVLTKTAGFTGLCGESVQGNFFLLKALIEDTTYILYLNIKVLYPAYTLLRDDDN